MFFRSRRSTAPIAPNLSHSRMSEYPFSNERRIRLSVSRSHRPRRRAPQPQRFLKRARLRPIRTYMHGTRNSLTPRAPRKLRRPVAAAVTLCAIVMMAGTSSATTNEVSEFPKCADLVAGETRIGEVCITVDQTVRVVYELVDGWVLNDVRVAASSALAGLPTTPEGDPDLDRFDGRSWSETAGVIVVEVDRPKGQQLVVAVNALATQDDSNRAESAWAVGTNFGDSASYLQGSNGDETPQSGRQDHLPVPAITPATIDPAASM